MRFLGGGVEEREREVCRRERESPLARPSPPPARAFAAGRGQRAQQWRRAPLGSIGGGITCRGGRSPLHPRPPPLARRAGNRRRRRRSPNRPSSPQLTFPQPTPQSLHNPTHTHKQAGHGHGADTVTYAGLTLRRRSTLQYGLSKAVGTAAWFWVFLMLYNEWDHKTKGLPAIFEAEGLDEEEGGDHHH